MPGVYKVRPFYRRVSRVNKGVGQSLWPLSVDVFVPSLAVSVCPQQCIFPISSVGMVKFLLSQKLIPPHKCHRLPSGPERAASAEGGGEEKACRIGYLGRLAGHQGILGSLLTWLCDSNASVDPPLHHMPFPPTSASTVSFTPLQPFSAFHLQREAIPHTPPTRDHPAQMHLSDYSICRVIWEIGDIAMNLQPRSILFRPGRPPWCFSLLHLRCMPHAICSWLERSLFPSHLFISLVRSHRCHLFACLSYNFTSPT